LIQVTNTTNGSSAIVLGSPLGTFAGAKTAKVTFSRKAGAYALEQVYLPSGVAFELPHAAAR
jgi:hypothetical protein